jgi:transcriptional regulator GlxA family with amidase domain
VDIRIQIVLSLIERDIHLTKEPRKMADEVRLSLSRFYDLFRQETGTVPARYLRALRFQKAQELLVNSYLSVKEIANAVGIHDVSHFVRDFQKIYGISPRRFRRSYGFVWPPDTVTLPPENSLINRNSGQ